jgi:hypothetical protein
MKNDDSVPTYQAAPSILYHFKMHREGIPERVIKNVKQRPGLPLLLVSQTLLVVVIIDSIIGSLQQLPTIAGVAVYSLTAGAIIELIVASGEGT